MRVSFVILASFFHTRLLSRQADRLELECHVNMTTLSKVEAIYLFIYRLVRVGLATHFSIQHIVLSVLLESKIYAYLLSFSPMQYSVLVCDIQKLYKNVLFCSTVRLQ